MESADKKTTTWDWLHLMMKVQLVSPNDFKNLRKKCQDLNQNHYWKASVKVDGEWRAVTIALWSSDLYESEVWNTLSQYGLDHAIEKCLIEGYKVECIRIKSDLAKHSDIVKCLTQGLSIRETAAKCNKSKTTVQKIKNILGNKNEADPTEGDNS